jgi:catechol 2,3-dioxygenase-like lactoylglutathione lyase family enzyme
MRTAAITGLFHVAVKTVDLAATRRFYTDVIGLDEAARPDFGYPGAWFALPGGGGAAILHVYAGRAALGSDGAVPVGSGAIDHVSLSAIGYRTYVQRFEAAGLPWREFVVPGTSYWQLFVYDPSGVQLELTFDAHIEGGSAPQIPEHLRYRAGNSFFEPQLNAY